jgi:hypothetical protein
MSTTVRIRDEEEEMLQELTLNMMIETKSRIKESDVLNTLGEFKHEVRQFEKSYDNQQAEQISLMV